MRQKRLPKEVVARAKAATTAPPETRAKPTAPSTSLKVNGGVRAKLVAHLKRLHPMD